MLTDIERKVLRILFNFSNLNKRTPTFDDLQLKTGRNKNGVIDAISGLADKQFIIWEPQRTETIQILRAWEVEPKAPEKPSPISTWPFD